MSLRTVDFGQANTNHAWTRYTVIYADPQNSNDKNKITYILLNSYKFSVISQLLTCIIKAKLSGC